jgi:uncharacterized protein
LQAMINIAEIKEKVLIRRDLLSSILPWIKERVCILIVGSRQVGKTSLLYLLVQYLFDQKELLDDNLCFLDLEDPADLELAGLSPEDLFNALKLRGKKWDKKRPIYIILDEIHLLENPARLIKLLVDHYPQASLLATGSSSTGVRQKFSDSLPGRKQEFFLPPLNFGEYLEFVGKENMRKYLFEIDDLFNEGIKLISTQLASTLLHDIQRDLDEYIVYGGYPGVTLTKDAGMKKRRLGAIFNDYVRKDLGSIFSIEHLNQFTRLVKILAAQTGGLLTYSHLASALGLNQRTIGRYMDILEATFILTRLFPYRTNIKKRLIKAPKTYFYDNGLRNIALGDFAPIQNRSDKGELAENMIFQYLLRKAQIPDDLELSFWRTSTGGEVDFIWNDILIEVKGGNFTGNPPRAILSCMKDTRITKALILNKNRVERLRNENRDIVFFPYGLIK